MIIFSQGPTEHSRLGNSIVWMTKAAYIAKQLGWQVAFPWASENFVAYLAPNSYWLEAIKQARDSYLDKFDVPLTAASISRQSRKYEALFEADNQLPAFGWERAVYSDESNNVLYLRGKIDITSEKVLSLVESHALTIIHEPFELMYLENLSLIGEDYASVIPKKRLFNAQAKHVAEIAAGRPTVGMHIRRGDYSRWQGGSYYYDDDFWCTNAARFVASGKSVWVFSNELSDELKARLLSHATNIPDEDFNHHFVRMMFMGKIFGPPSTFSSTAANVAKKVFGLKCDFIYLPKTQ
jgi:hypothetical protein